MENTSGNKFQISYSRAETVLLNIETDAEFIKNIRKIAEKKKSVDYQLFKEEEDLPEEDIEEIAELAIRHQEANIFNKTSMVFFDKIDDEISCNCGCRRGQGAYFPLCLNEQNFTFLGPGVLLFFYYLRNLRNLVLCIFLVYGAFACFTNALGTNYIDNCSPYKEQNMVQYDLCVFVEIMSYSNKPDSWFLKNLQLWLGILLCTVWLFGLKFIGIMGYEKDRNIDSRLDSASDYNIKIDNLPYANFNEIELIELIENLWHEYGPPEPLEIKSVQIIYNMERVRELIEEIQLRSIQLTGMFKVTSYQFSNTLRDDKILEYKRMKKEVIDKITQLQQMRIKFLSNPQFRRQLATTCAIIEMEQSEQQVKLLRILGCKKSPFQTSSSPSVELEFKGQEFTVTRAPEPSDINWLNCEKRYSYFRNVQIFLATMLILVTGYTAIIFMQTTQFFKSLGVFVIPIVLQLSNRVIWIMLGHLVPYEYNNTKSDAIISLMKKSMTAQAINIVFTPIAAIYYNNQQIYGHDGLQGVTFYFQWSMLILMQVYYLFEPFYVLKTLAFKITWIRNIIINRMVKFRPSFEDYEVFMPVLNAYEGPQFPAAGGYVYMVTSIFHCLFYCHLQPAIMLFVILNISVFFVITKYMLLRRCKIPELTEIQVFELAIFSFSMGAAFYGGGSLFFVVSSVISVENRSIEYYDVLPSLVCLLIWGICTVNPNKFMEKFIRRCIRYFEYQSEFSELKAEDEIAEETNIFMSDQNKNDKFKETIMVEPIIHSVLFDTQYLENKTWARRESYYRDSGVNKLLEFEKYLKDNDSITMTKSQRKKCRSNARLKDFCEGFFKARRSINLQELPENSELFLVDKEKAFDLIPVKIVKEKKRSILIKKTESVQLSDIDESNLQDEDHDLEQIPEEAH